MFGSLQEHSRSFNYNRRATAELWSVCVCVCVCVAQFQDSLNGGQENSPGCISYGYSVFAILGTDHKADRTDMSTVCCLYP